MHAYTVWEVKNWFRKYGVICEANRRFIHVDIHLFQEEFTGG
jgi:hypothetical protein